MRLGCRETLERMGWLVHFYTEGIRSGWCGCWFFRFFFFFFDFFSGGDGG